MDRDGIPNTFIVAGAVCLVCSACVALAAVSLKSKQDINVALDIKKNILVSAGLLDPSNKEDMTNNSINSTFDTKIVDVVIELETGKDVSGEFSEVADYDQEKAAKSNEYVIPAELNIAQINNRALKAHVYKVVADEETIHYVFPVKGTGLWSTLKGFVALDKDLKTVKGLSFYSHGETPGLGGEVDNPTWKAQWNGKELFVESEGKFVPSIDFVKGKTKESTKFDGLSGATITTKGVKNLLNYWFGEDGFGPFLDTLRQSETAS